jgi:eukaryotic-like serine/threonine-protein kinase
LKSFFHIALRGLILVVVAMISGLTAMRFAIHGREVAVPNLAGRTMAEARKMTEEKGLGLALERRYYSPEVADGKVLSQVPPAGTKVRRGWQVRVAESMGAQRVQILSVIGQSQRAAEINIRRRGLEVGTVAQMALPDAPADRVISQSPPPNASDVSAPKINLLVSNSAQPRAFVMPTLVGQPLGSAQIALRDASLKPGNVTVAGGTGNVSPASIVVAQTPGAGDKILAGDAVSFQVR